LQSRTQQKAGEQLKRAGEGAFCCGLAASEDRDEEQAEKCERRRQRKPMKSY